MHLLYFSLLLPLCSYGMNGMKEVPKFCKDCIFSKSSIMDNITLGKSFLKCSNFPKMEFDSSYLVDGIKKKEDLIDLYYCSTARNTENMCGVNALYFKKKEKRISAVFEKKWLR